MTSPAPEPIFSRGFVGVFLLGFAVLLAIYYEPRTRDWTAVARWGIAVGWLVAIGGLLAFVWLGLRGRKSA